MVGNFGNFFALAVLFLFAKDLPLSPVQLLLTNLLTDLPLIAISTDNVAHSEIVSPSKYDIRRLMNSSVILGIVTAALILIFFYFVKSVLPIGKTELFLFITISQLAIIFSVRSEKFLWQANRPSRPLVFSFLITVILTIFLIYFRPLGSLFSLEPLPTVNLLAILGFTGICLAILDSSKIFIINRFYGHKKNSIHAIRLSAPPAGGGWPDGTS